MSFPFKHNPRKETFKFTFLNEVAFKLTFAEGLDSIQFERWQSFFKDTFGLDFIMARYEEMIDTRIKVGNKETGLEFEFSRFAIRISLPQQTYATYQTSFEPTIRLLAENLGKLTDSCDNVAMKFVDVWPFTEEKDFSENDIRKLKDAIFSKDLQEMAEAEDGDFKIYTSEDGRMKIHIKYGSFVSNESENKIAGVALETKCELRDGGQILELAKVVETASEMNDLLYDAFIWSVSPFVINLMKQPGGEKK